MCGPPDSLPCVYGRERYTDRQGEHPGSVAENPGLEVPKSGTETHTETRTHTHALPEVDKYRPTNTKCHRGRKSALTSCCQEDRMPTPGHCHFHLALGTWAPLARIPPNGSSSPPLASPRQLPTSQVCEHENNTSKAPSGGARTRREPQCAGDGGPNVPITGRVAPGILTAVPRGGSCQPARASRRAVLTRDARPGSRRWGQCGNTGIPGLRGPRQ